jgi:hypothetical protein
MKNFFNKLLTITFLILLFLFSKSLISKDIPIEQLVDFTGPTSSVEKG